MSRIDNNEDQIRTASLPEAGGDRFFTTSDRQRLQELMQRWRAARDVGSALPEDEQRELEVLVDAEIRAAGRRAAATVLIPEPRRVDEE